MKTLLFGLIVALLCNLAQAVEVTATGYGSSFDESLQNAKVLATEYAASTFLTGKQELTGGKYKETLGQYNGGLVQKYTVKNTVVNAGVYAVTIQADVNTDKINSIIKNGESSPASAIPQIEKAVDEYEKSEAALTAITKVSDPFVVKLEGSTYTVTDSNTMVLASYHAHLMWNPKWVDDVKQLLKAVNRPINTSQQGICFGPKHASTYACGGIAVLPDWSKWKQIKYVATIYYEDGTTETQTWPANTVVNAVDLFTHNYDQHVNVDPPASTFRKVAEWAAATAVMPGISTIALAIRDSQVKYSTVDTLFIFSDQVSPKFDFVLEFKVAEFKKVSNVSFAPAL